MNIGDTVTWESQSGGHIKRKTGKVIGFIATNESAIPILRKFGINYNSNRVKFQSLSELDQVLVEVPRVGKSTLSDFYAPRKTQVSVLPKAPESTEPHSEAEDD